MSARNRTPIYSFGDCRLDRWTTLICVYERILSENWMYVQWKKQTLASSIFSCLLCVLRGLLGQLEDAAEANMPVGRAQIACLRSVHEIQYSTDFCAAQLFTAGARISVALSASAERKFRLVMVDCC